MKFPAIIALGLLAACSSPNKYAKYIEKGPITNRNQYMKEFAMEAANNNIGTFDFEREPDEVFVTPDEFFTILISEIEYSEKQRELIDYGMQYVGTPYYFGGASPETGFDCSGFTQYVYKTTLHQNLPRTAKEMAAIGTPVNDDQLKPGDLVFFNTRGFDYSHVGIYIGEGKFFHASPSRNEMTIGDMTKDYFVHRYNGARRVLS